MSPPRLPRARPGDFVRAEMFNELADAVRRCSVSVANGPGLASRSGPGGTVLWAAPAASGARYALTTSSVGPSTSASVLGSGTASLQTQSGTGLSASGAPDVTIYNQTTKTIATGKLVTLIQVEGNWSVVNVRDCGDAT